MNNFNRKISQFSLVMTLGLVINSVGDAFSIEKFKRNEPPKVKIGLNCYSFNQPLIAKTLTVEEMSVSYTHLTLPTKRIV